MNTTLRGFFVWVFAMPRLISIEGWPELNAALDELEATCARRIGNGNASVIL